MRAIHVPSPDWDCMGTSAMRRCCHKFLICRIMLRCLQSCVGMLVAAFSRRYTEVRVRWVATNPPVIDHGSTNSSEFAPTLWTCVGIRHEASIVLVDRLKTGRASSLANVFRFGFASLSIFTQFIGYPLPLAERPATLKRGYVNENVLTAVLRCDETKTLVVVEKLYRTSCHV